MHEFPLVRLGDLGVRLYVCNSTAKQQAESIWDWLPDEQQLPPVEEWSLTIISAQIPLEEDCLALVPEDQQDLCRDIQSRWVALALKPVTYEQAWEVFWHPFSRWSDLKGNLASGTRFLYRNRKDQKQQQVFFLVGDDSQLYSELSSCLLLISTWWHALHGGLLLHASAVADGDKGFLFLGKSGAGKSTVASLAIGLEKQVVADDTILLSRNHRGDYLLRYAPRIWPQITTDPSLHPSLRGIFTLVQDNEDYLVPHSPISLAKALVKGYQHTHSLQIPIQARRSSFQAISEISRRVPGYELHFRKTPDFWKLIDERFPD